MTWTCNCSNINPDEQPTCNNCGLVRIGPGTLDKYALLSGYLPQLSKIMRFRDYKHYFIDACAGSGIVWDPEKENLLDGSPLIMAKSRETADKLLKDKNKKKEVKCKFIEYEEKTYERLKHAVGQYGFVQCVRGDCNEKLDTVLDEISSTEKNKNHFAFVYIDPFGLGKPAIRQETISRILERPFTELLIHFSWEGVSRMAGFYKNIDNPDASLAHQARAYADSLDAYLGQGWQEIEKRGLHPHGRRKAYVELYDSRLKQYYPGTINTEIPVGSNNPNYYLFFATRNNAGKEIMSNILRSVRLKGSMPLDGLPQEGDIMNQPAKKSNSLDDYFENTTTK